VDDEGCRQFMILPEVYKNELCKGFDQRMVTRVLLNFGWIIPASDGKVSHKPRIRGVGTPRLYYFTNRIWEGD
jgi:putative DNA primase/helicase